MTKAIHQNLMVWKIFGSVYTPAARPEQLDYAGKRVVVIGSGATAVTVVPAMAQTAGHVTMLRRSPTYVLSRPDTDTASLTMRKYLQSSWPTHLHAGKMSPYRP